MFKKSNRNFRVKKAEFDSEDESVSCSEKDKNHSKKSAVNAEIKKEKISPEIIKSNKKDSNVSSKNTILSFEDELIEEESGFVSEFKVKKSRESRRITKELKRSKKEKERQLKIENGTLKEEDLKQKNKTEVLTSEDILFSEGIKVKPLTLNQTENKKIPKFLVNKYKSSNAKSDDESFVFDDYKEKVSKETDSSSSNESSEEDEQSKLERLRQEMQILNGEEVDTIENETDETKRSMKLMLQSGIIPDASMIHAARKKREMARQGDYIPIGDDNTIRYENNKSRMIREDDDNDLSDDGEGETTAANSRDSRISLNFKQKVYIERQKDRDNFLAYEQGSDDDEFTRKKNSDETDEKHDENDDDDEEDEWEKEQIRKGVQINKAFPSKLDFRANSNENRKLLESVLGSNLEQEPMDIEPKSFDLEKLNNMPIVTFESIKDTIRKNLSLLKETNRTSIREQEMTLENLNAHITDFENIKTMRPSLDKQYIFYQEMQSFIRDFVDCYDEKIPEIESIEKEWLDLMKQKAQKIIKRRQDDIKDQSLEFSSFSGPRKIADSAHQQRLTEREARRAKRKSKREKEISKRNKLDLSANDGFSSDNEENDTEENLFRQKRTGLISKLKENIENDIDENFYRFDLIKERFEKWIQLNESAYRNAYVSLSLPKLFSPLLRIELLDWNPLEEELSNNGVEKSKWFRELITFNKEVLEKSLKDSSKTNDIEDFLLVPHLIEKTCLLKLIDLAQNIYDPMSTTQTIRFSKIIFSFIQNYPTVNYKSSNTKKLIETIASTLRKSFENDIFLPLYPKNLIDLKSSEQSKFFFRQFWSCAKLFGNVLKWKGVLSDTLIKEFCLDCVLNRYLMIGLQSMEANINTIEIIEFLIDQLPSRWLETNIETTGSMSLPQRTSICRLIRRIADNIHQNEFLTKKIDPNDFKKSIRQIKHLFNKIGAIDQAISLSNSYELT